MGREYGKDSAMLGPLPMLGSVPLSYNTLRAGTSYSRFGIFAQWKPIEGGTKIAEIQRINEEIKQLNTQEMAVKTTLEEHIRQVVNKALSCYFSIEKDYKAMFAAKENYEKVKADYLQNKVQIAQVLDAQNDFFKQLVWVQRGICSVNWTKADPSAKDWIKKVKTELVALPDIQL